MLGRVSMATACVVSMVVVACHGSLFAHTATWYDTTDEAHAALDATLHAPYGRGMGVESRCGGIVIVQRSTGENYGVARGGTRVARASSSAMASAQTSGVSAEWP